MLGVNESSAYIFMWHGKNEWNFKVSWNDSISKDRLKRIISPFLEVGFEKFVHTDMYNYIANLKIVKWNSFYTDQWE